ncbi:MAG: hypothetical protein GF384_00315, partial [Elusimicrobia bacterium]|nr:hypothetical protein [Elusimicrobiota bacterium]MBD3411539.1 hypothetical protein [Elusimicrobiota bacterium]
AYNYGFVSEKIISILNPDHSFNENLIRVANPTSREYVIMRNSLIPGLVGNVRINTARQIEPVKLFEVGAVFMKKDNQPIEHLMCAGILCGREKRRWSGPSTMLDFADLKGVLDLVFRSLAVKGMHLQQDNRPHLQPGRSASVYIDNQCIGTCGQLHRRICEFFEIDMPVYAFEIETRSIRKKESIAQTYKAIPRYPAITRDFSFVLDAGVTWDSIQKEVYAAGSDLIEDIRPFDRYVSKKFGSNRYGLSFSVVLRSLEKTLTDSDADRVQTAIISRLRETLKASLRT